MLDAVKVTVGAAQFSISRLDYDIATGRFDHWGDGSRIAAWE
jgi:hypothetical protein